MAWYAIYETATGHAVSYTDEEPVSLRPELSYKLIAGLPSKSLMWSDAVADMVARPAKVFTDRIEEFVNDLRAEGLALNAQNETRVRNVLNTYFVRQRFHGPSEPKDL